VIDKLVQAICPNMPKDRKVVETSIKDKYFHVDLREHILYVPRNDVLRANLGMIDSFTEACRAFGNMTDTDFNAFKYDWNFLKEYPERHQSFYVWDWDSQHTLQKIEEGVADGKVSPYVSVDIETRKIHWEDNHVLLIGIGWMSADMQYEYSSTFCVSAQALSEDMYKEMWQAFQDFFANKDIHFIWHNGKFDTGRLKYLMNMDARVDEDTMLMHYVGINERRGTHGLKDLGSLYLQAPKWDDKLDEYKKTWCREHKIKLADFTYDLIPLPVLVPYLHMDCISTLRLYHLFSRLMRVESKQIYKLLIKASNAYRELELNGIKLDVNYLSELRDSLEERIEDAQAEVDKTAALLWDPIRYTKESGARSVPKAFSIKSPKQLKWMLEKIMGRRIESTGKDVLEELAAEVEHQEDSVGKEFIKAIFELRKANKYLDTYVTGIQEELCRDLRVRATYNLHGTETGRLSCSAPNMQNIPRDKTIKNLFVAPQGKILLQLDYSQAELRVLAYLSDDDWLTDVYVQGHDLHDKVAEQMFGPDFNKEQRVMAKTINFGIAYGRGAASLSETFGLSMPEAQKLIDNWFAPMPNVKKYLSDQKRAPFRGINITTAFGRMRSFIITNDNRYHVQNEAMNMAIQSTASDCTMISLCTIQDWIKEKGYQDKVKICITVHDSIVLEVDDNKALIDEVATECTQVMSNVPKKYLSNNRVPFRADAEVGYSWGNMKEWVPDEG
jgi:DNA polymerase-1